MPAITMNSLFSRGVLTLLITSALTAAQVIVPGATWTDTSGNVIQAHGGGILKVRLCRRLSRPVYAMLTTFVAH